MVFWVVWVPVSGRRRRPFTSSRQLMVKFLSSRWESCFVIFFPSHTIFLILRHTFLAPCFLSRPVFTLVVTHFPFFFSTWRNTISLTPYFSFPIYVVFLSSSHRVFFPPSFVFPVIRFPLHFTCIPPPHTFLLLLQHYTKTCRKFLHARLGVKGKRQEGVREENKWVKWDKRQAKNPVQKR